MYAFFPGVGVLGNICQVFELFGFILQDKKGSLFRKFLTKESQSIDFAMSCNTFPAIFCMPDY